MKKSLPIVPRWFPALFMMLVIFAFSSLPGDNLPNFLTWDYIVKKASHSIGYGLLALSYLHLLKDNTRRYWLAWLMAVVYSATDEFHQSFVSGRNAFIYDVIIFDNLGSIFALSLDYFFRRKHEKANQQT